MNDSDQFRVTIPDDAWEETGEYNADADGKALPWTRLRVTLKINDTMLHLEAYAVKGARGEGGCYDIVELYDDDVDECAGRIIGDGGWPPEISTIRGHDYVLIATPFGD